MLSSIDLYIDDQVTGHLDICVQEWMIPDDQVKTLTLTVSIWHTRDVHSRCIAIAIALGIAQNHDIPRKGQLCRPAPSFTNCVHDCSTGAATTRRSWQVNHPYVQGWWSNRLKCNCRLQLRLSWNEKVPNPAKADLVVVIMIYYMRSSWRI